MGVMVMMVVVVMVVYNHHDLRLRRVRHCEAEEEHRSKPKLFHALS
jgi:hypothetical protein